METEAKWWWCFWIDLFWSQHHFQANRDCSLSTVLRSEAGSQNVSSDLDENFSIWSKSKCIKWFHWLTWIGYIQLNYQHLFLCCPDLFFEPCIHIIGLYNSKDWYLGLVVSLWVHLACTATFHFIFFTTLKFHAVFLSNCNKMTLHKKTIKDHSTRKQKVTSSCLILNVLCTVRNW